MATLSGWMGPYGRIAGGGMAGSIGCLGSATENIWDKQDCGSFTDARYIIGTLKNKANICV